MSKLFIPNLFEYLFDFIERKGHKLLFHILDREDFLKVRNESKIRQFVEKAKLEDVLILCSKIGMGTGLFFWDTEKEKTNKVQDILIAYLNTPAHEMPVVVVKDKIFCTLDLDIIRSLQTVAKISHGPSYSINRKYLTIRDTAYDKFRPRTLVDKLNADRNLDWYSKTIQYALDIEPILDTFKIDIVQFRILLYLQTSPNGATKDSITQKLDRTHVTGMLHGMEKMNMISYDRTNKNVVHIGVYGLMILDQIFAKFP